MNAHEKFDRLKFMVIERILAEGFKKRGNSMTTSTEIMKVLVNIQKYKGGTEFQTLMLINIGVFPLSETCMREYGVEKARLWFDYPLAARLPSILSRAMIDEYEIYNDEISAEEFFMLRIGPDLQNLFSWMKQTKTFEMLLESVTMPFRFHNYPIHTNMVALCILKDIDPMRFKETLNRLILEDPYYIELLRRHPGVLMPDILPKADAFHSQ